MRTAGTTITTATLGEAVKAFVPHRCRLPTHMLPRWLGRLLARLRCYLVGCPGSAAADELWRAM
jgi:hypothetical protein